MKLLDVFGFFQGLVHGVSKGAGAPAVYDPDLLQMSQVRIVDIFAYERILGLSHQVAPAGIGRHEEDIFGLVFLLVLWVCPLVFQLDQFLVQFLFFAPELSNLLLPILVPVFPYNLDRKK